MSTIFFLMFVSFFAGGNLCICVKDLKYKGEVLPINIMGTIAGAITMIILSLNILGSF